MSARGALSSSRYSERLRSTLLASWLAAVPFTLLAMHASAQENTAATPPADLPTELNPSVDPSQTGIPSSQDLEAAGAIIGAIRIVNNNVFATETKEEDYALFRLANRLHIKTRPNALESQLLIKSGEPYTDRLVRESERILRRNRYLYDAQIVPVSYADGRVDLEVRTRDVWTLKPGIQYGRSGGKSTTGFEIQESNLLGYGTEVTVGRKTDVDRTSTEFRYFDPHILNSHYRTHWSYSQNSDGGRRDVWVDRPFYSLDSRWAAYVNALDWERTDRRYNLGNIVDEFRHRQERFEIAGGLSNGWQNGWVRRLNFGLNYVQDRFAPTQSLLSAQEIPKDRLLAYPFVGFTLLQDDYEERRNQNQIERIEDLYAGTFLQGSIGLAQPAWGADRKAWLLSLAGGTAFESQQRIHTLVLASNASGRFEDGAGRNLLLNAETTYYWRVTRKQLFYATLRGALSKELDADKQLLLGGDTGLRGYPLRYQDGTAHALLTLEHRVYTDYYLFRLFHLGGAVFFDAGRAWGSGNSRLAQAPTPPGVESNQGLLRDAGLGLRFGSSRSAFGNVIHVDLAFPLDGDDTIKRTQFIIETKTSF